MAKVAIWSWILTGLPRVLLLIWLVIVVVLLLLYRILSLVQCLILLLVLGLTVEKDFVDRHLTWYHWVVLCIQLLLSLLLGLLLWLWTILDQLLRRRHLLVLLNNVSITYGTLDLMLLQKLRLALRHPSTLHNCEVDQWLTTLFLRYLLVTGLGILREWRPFNHHSG